jgi:hypothetical protein
MQFHPIFCNALFLVQILSSALCFKTFSVRVFFFFSLRRRANLLYRVAVNGTSIYYGSTSTLHVSTGIGHPQVSAHIHICHTLSEEPSKPTDKILLFIYFNLYVCRLDMEKYNWMNSPSPNFYPLLTSVCNFDVTKYLNFATVSNDLLSIVILFFALHFGD